MGIYYDGQGVPQNFVTAYMWPNLATSNGNDLANEAGDAIAKVQNAIVSEMSPAAIERAQARAAQFLASDYQDCGG